MRTAPCTRLTNTLVLTGLLVFLSLVLITLYLVPPRPANAQSVDLKTSAVKWSGDGLKLELQAMPLDLVRAFFIGRGFDAKDAEFIARTGCVFRSAIGNAGSSTSDPDITIELKKWRVITDGASKGPMTREDWADVWSARKVDEMPRVAFHWALFPTEQQYNPTDYNWGMITFALPPRSIFDLQVVWSKSGTLQRHLIKNLECGK